MSISFIGPWLSGMKTLLFLVAGMIVATIFSVVLGITIGLLLSVVSELSKVVLFMIGGVLFIIVVPWAIGQTIFGWDFDKT